MFITKTTVLKILLRHYVTPSGLLDESGSGSVSENEEEFPDTSITVAHISGET